MEYAFLVDTYDTERLKTLTVWSMFKDEDLPARVHPLPERDRNPLEHMVHQCMSENKWFRTMLGIDVGAPPLPEKETRLEFIKRYAEDSGKRASALREKDKTWWEQEVSFFDVRRTRAWIMVRRIAHTAHHRAEMTTMLRIMGREVHSVYGPSVDTGGLPDNNALTIYAYPDIESLIEGEAGGGRKAVLPGPGSKPSTERPDL
ncbi:MAG TPA: DinB family protein [Dissulfurispiraceae bacterium]|nr:DinB family protein [Dissulfurispiraceae bacterium]